jgi:hypothetical protein
MKQWKYLLVGAAVLTFGTGSSFADDVDRVTFQLAVNRKFAACLGNPGEPAPQALANISRMNDIT